MTEPTQLLALLADIDEPALSESFALAPGHWLLLLLLVAACLFALTIALRYWRFQRPKRLARRLWQQLDATDPTMPAQLNQLLKRLLKAYAPQHPLLTADTESWQQHWQSQLSAPLQLPPLQPLLYQAPTQHNALERQQLYQCGGVFIQRFNGRLYQHTTSPATGPGTGVDHAGA